MCERIVSVELAAYRGPNAPSCGSSAGLGSPARVGVCCRDYPVRRVAVAIRTGYPCDGMTVLQNNEPAGDQDVWHLYTHMIPRYIGDGMHLGVPVRADDRDRARYAARLRELLG